jgi:hypothetical protein
VLWSTPDGTGFEFAGYVEDGFAIGENDHFSDAGAYDEEGACDEEEGVADDCDHACAGSVEGDEPAPPASCGGQVGEPCERLCWCDPTDGFGGRLCAVDTGDPDAACPETNDQIGEVVTGELPAPARGDEFLAPRDGASCNGFEERPIEAILCDCIGDGYLSEGVRLRDVTMCPVGRWVDRDGDPGTIDWACTSDLEGQAPGELRGRRRLDDLATLAFSGVDGQACNGEYIDYQNRPARGLATAMRNCRAVPQIVGRELVALEGTASRCIPFRWPDAAAAQAASSGNAGGCGDLTDEDWQRLDQAREEMGMPGGTHDRPGTAAILDVDGAEYRGFNAGAYPGENAQTPNDFCGPGGHSHKHAEGDALNQLAIQRGSQPVVSRSANGGRCPPQTSGFHKESRIGNCPEGVRGQGEMIVDRAPCARNCALYAIDRMRRAACLESLTVRSPSGTRRFAEGLPETGALP